MNRVIANIHIKKTEEKDRATPISIPIYSATVFFEDVPALQEHGYDCRMLVAEHGNPIPPGGTADEIALLFLSADEVLPHMTPGITFTLWEGKTIGSGGVVRVEDQGQGLADRFQI